MPDIEFEYHEVGWPLLLIEFTVLVLLVIGAFWLVRFLRRR